MHITRAITVTNVVYMSAGTIEFGVFLWLSSSTTGQNHQFRRNKLLLAILVQKENISNPNCFKILALATVESMNS